jgi:hypothetical protein
VHGPNVLWVGGPPACAGIPRPGGAVGANSHNFRDAEGCAGASDCMPQGGDVCTFKRGEPDKNGCIAMLMAEAGADAMALFSRHGNVIFVVSVSYKDTSVTCFFL